MPLSVVYQVSLNYMFSNANQQIVLQVCFYIEVTVSVKLGKWFNEVMPVSCAEISTYNL